MPLNNFELERPAKIFTKADHKVRTLNRQGMRAEACPGAPKFEPHEITPDRIATYKVDMALRRPEAVRKLSSRDVFGACDVVAEMSIYGAPQTRRQLFQLGREQAGREHLAIAETFGSFTSPDYFRTEDLVELRLMCTLALAKGGKGVGIREQGFLRLPGRTAREFAKPEFARRFVQFGIDHDLCTTGIVKPPFECNMGFKSQYVIQFLDEENRGRPASEQLGYQVEAGDCDQPPAMAFADLAMGGGRRQVWEALNSVLTFASETIYPGHTINWRDPKVINPASDLLEWAV